MANFTCGTCQFSTDAADEHVGRRTKCPRCQAPGFVVPDVPPMPEEPAGPKNDPSRRGTASAQAKSQSAEPLRIQPHSPHSEPEANRIKPSARPLGVVLAAVWSGVVALLHAGGFFLVLISAALAGTAASSLPADSVPAEFDTAVNSLFFVGGLALMSIVVHAALVFGLLTLQGWAYGLTLAVYALHCLAGVVELVTDASQYPALQILFTVIAVGILAYFVQPNTRRLFR